MNINDLKVGETFDCPINILEPDPDQPRKDKDREHIHNLGVSMAAEGQHEAIRVRRHPQKDGMLMIVVGECRYLAHVNNRELAAKGTIRATLVEYASDIDLYMAQVIENDMRKDLGVLEQLRSWGRAIDRGATLDKLAGALGKEKRALEKELSLLSLPEAVQDAIDRKDCPKVVAFHILDRFPGHDARQNKAWSKACDKKGAKNMMAEIDAYHAAVNQTELFDNIPPLKEMSSDALKGAGKEYGRLARAITKFAESPYANGKGPYVIAARRKNLTELEEMAKQMVRMGQKLQEEARLYRAGHPVQEQANG